MLTGGDLIVTAYSHLADAFDSKLIEGSATLSSDLFSLIGPTQARYCTSVHRFNPGTILLLGWPIVSSSFLIDSDVLRKHCYCS